jgi:membrane-bound lytic murein transglycosylase D
MNFKTLYITCLILMVNSTFVFSQEKKSDKVKSRNDELVIDSILTVPAEFDNTLDYMLQSWVIQRLSTLNCKSGNENVAVSDSILKLRLSKMPCLMEMPFNPTVRSFIDLYTVRKRKQVEYMLGMSNYYFPMFEQVLGENNLPLELKYLSIIESALNTTIVSRMGAAGLWQLMIGTGRMYGLEINSLVDERLSPIKATNAAAHFMKDLFSIYGDWNLVIASYNCGPGNVNKAIRRSGGKRDYWAIYPYLPKETRSYVPVFIAANYSLHYAKEHNLCPAIVNMPVITDTVMVHQRIHLEQVASVLNLPIEEVRLLNPQYRRDIIPGNIKPYVLCLPLNYANTFIDKFNEVVSYKADELINNRRSEIEILQTATTLIPGGAGKVIYYKVKSGQNLGSIAARYGVSVTKLKKWNNIHGNVIRTGQRLKIIK